jgi:hypothetical protein
LDNFEIKPTLHMKKIAEMCSLVSEKNIEFTASDSFQNFTPLQSKDLNHIIALSEIFFTVNTFVSLPVYYKVFFLKLYSNGAYGDSDITLKIYQEKENLKPVDIVKYREALNVLKALNIIEGKGINQRWQVFKINDTGVIVAKVFLALYENSNKNFDVTLEALIDNLIQQENN